MANGNACLPSRQQPHLSLSTGGDGGAGTKGAREPSVLCPARVVAPARRGTGQRERSQRRVCASCPSALKPYTLLYRLRAELESRGDRSPSCAPVPARGRRHLAPPEFRRIRMRNRSMMASGHQDEVSWSRISPTPGVGFRRYPRAPSIKVLMVQTFRAFVAVSSCSLSSLPSRLCFRAVASLSAATAAA